MLLDRNVRRATHLMNLSQETSRSAEFSHLTACGMLFDTEIAGWEPEAVLYREYRR